MHALIQWTLIAHKELDARGYRDERLWFGAARWD